MKLWPSRTKAKNVDPVTDLDAIISEPVPFRFKGKTHFLKPVTVAEFLKFANANPKLLNGITEPDLTAQILAERYFDVISSVCDTITLKDIQSMEQAQVAALYQLVLDMVTGQVDMGDGKKKRKKVDLYDTAARSSLPNAGSTSGGPQSKS